MLQTVASVLLLCVGLYLLRSLRHHRPFAVFNNIYGHAAVDIVVFAVSIYALVPWFGFVAVRVVVALAVWSAGRI